MDPDFKPPPPNMNGLKEVAALRARVAALEQLLRASIRLATAYTALEECYRESDEENAATDAATGTMDEAFREFAATLNKINPRKGSPWN